jgi:hypothetical protein
LNDAAATRQKKGIITPQASNFPLHRQARRFCRQKALPLIQTA